jgi:hypothetical protein
LGFQQCSRRRSANKNEVSASADNHEKEANQHIVCAIGQRLLQTLLVLSLNQAVIA